MSTPYAPPPPAQREAATESAGAGIDKSQYTRGPRRPPRTYRSGTPLRHRPIPARLPRKAIAASDALTYMASREPDDPEEWSEWWRREWLR